MRKLGALRLSYEFLEKLLDFPSDAHITNVWADHEKGTMGMCISSPIMPELIEGAMLPNITLSDIKGWDE